MVVTTINNNIIIVRCLSCNGSLFLPRIWVAFIIFLDSQLRGEAPIRMEPAVSLVITMTSAKEIMIKSPAQLNFHVILSNSWILNYFCGQIWGFLSFLML